MPTLRRTSTTTGTIPAGTNATGTVTTNSIDNTRLDVAGVTNDDFIEEHNANIKRGNLWLYLPATNVISKIVGFNFNDTPLIILEQSVGSVSGATFQIIKGDLSSWEVANVGASAGTLDGATFTNGRSLSLSSKEYPTNRVLDVITFDATGTTFEITEVK